MSRICSFIVRKRLIFFILFIEALLVSAVCMPYVKINYDDTKYLPDTSNTKAGLLVMESEFGGGGTAQAIPTPAILRNFATKARVRRLRVWGRCLA